MCFENTYITCYIHILKDIMVNIMIYYYNIAICP